MNAVNGILYIKPPAMGSPLVFSSHEWLHFPPILHSPFSLIVFTIYFSRFVKHPFSLLADVLGSEKLVKRNNTV